MYRYLTEQELGTPDPLTGRFPEHSSLCVTKCSTCQASPGGQTVPMNLSLAGTVCSCGEGEAELREQNAQC